MEQLGIKLKLRRQVLATSCVFFQRFYARNPFAGSNGYLVCAACIYLAAKVEECPLHIRSITTELRALCNCTLESSAVADFEFKLLQELDFSLLVYHPYALLPDYLKMIGQETLLSLAWQVLNDLYKTRTPLLCPPQLMALAAIYFACQIRGTLTDEVLQSFSKYGTDTKLHELAYIIQDLLNLYQILRQNDYRDVQHILKKLEN